MIFLGITGSWTAAVMYDRREKRRIQRKWTKLVEHIASEPLGEHQMPRKITIYLSAPPAEATSDPSATSSNPSTTDEASPTAALEPPKPDEPEKPKEEESKPKKKKQPPPFNTTASYHESALAPSCPRALGPSTVIPF